MKRNFDFESEYRESHQYLIEKGHYKEAEALKKDFKAVKELEKAQMKQIHSLFAMAMFNAEHHPEKMLQSDLYDVFLCVYECACESGLRGTANFALIELRSLDRCTCPNPT